MPMTILILLKASTNGDTSVLIVFHRTSDTITAIEYNVEKGLPPKSSKLSLWNFLSWLFPSGAAIATSANPAVSKDYQSAWTEIT